MSHLHVTVLQSDAALRARLQRVLTQDGMHVNGFASPFAFIDSLAGDSVPDLLIVDLCLDEIDGWRLCRLLHSPQFAEAHALPLLLTSSVFFDADLARIAQSLGAGACLSLPASDGTILKAVRSALDRARPAQRTRALVAGDEELRLMVALTLEGAGYEVIQAATLAEARHHFRERSPEIVVIDQRLPDGHAREAIAEWRDQQRNRQPACLVVTGPSDRKTAVEFARQGVEACLARPFSPPVLAKVLADALHARTLRSVEELLHQKTLRLHETERKFRELYDKAPLGYHTIGPDGIILSMNATELQWLGYTAEELVGRKTIFDLQDRESAVRGRKAFEELKRVGAVHDVELVLVRKNGTPLPVSIEAKAVHSDTNEFLLSRTIVRDMTNRLEKEAQIRQAQRVESMATLVEGVAHSFNNLLTPVLINAGELLEAFPRGSEEREIVEEIALASKRAAGMIRQLALLGRSNRPPYAPADLRELIAETVGELRETFERTITIETDIVPGPTTITGNAAELKRALQALCFNAREAMPTGGILSIALSRATAAADEADPSQSRATSLMVAVTDTGPGVPPEISDRVFEPFFTTKPMARHVGLGLSTAYSIMRNHGGRAELDARESGRARFVLNFPAAAAPAETENPAGPSCAATPGRPAPAREARATILIADDERNIRHSAARVLSKAGYTVLEAEDGRACLNRVGETVAGSGEKRRIDLVVLDVVMPGMTCEEVLKALRPLRPDLPVVIATGHGDVLRLNEFLDHGARRVINKPFEKDRLLQVVREVLAEPAVQA